MPHHDGPLLARTAPPVTAAWLEHVASSYLDRYGASIAMLRRMLVRRVAKRAQRRGEEPEAFADLVEETIGRAIRAGLVDDARFATARLATLRRRGVSTRAAGAALTGRGIGRDLVRSTLAEERDETSPDGDVEAAAAEAYAKRRRLGPYRRPDLRAANRERDLAAMGRAGFPYLVARALIDAGREEADRGEPEA